MALWVALVVAAWGTDTTDTTDTTDSGVAETDKAKTDKAKTGDDDDTAFCVDCETAADLARESGGTPCGSGCSTDGAGPVALLPLALLVVARRRRRVA